MAQAIKKYIYLPGAKSKLNVLFCYLLYAIYYMLFTKNLKTKYAILVFLIYISMFCTNQFRNMLEKRRIYLAGLRRNSGNQFIYICQY